MGAPRDNAFEVFVRRAVTGIQKEASGRAKEMKLLRDACQACITALDSQDPDKYDIMPDLLHPLELAITSPNAKVIDLALGCLHKLVAHAWLYGESTPEGLLDGKENISKAIKMVVNCGNNQGETIQLSVIRALLTFTTAEHFIPHGESLMSSIRTVFNLALASDDENIQRTGCNALLQMMNTITKRITTYQVDESTANTPSMSRTASTVNMDDPASPPGINDPETAPSTPRDPNHADDADQRTAQYATLAEAHDMHALEVAMVGHTKGVVETDAAAAEQLLVASRANSETNSGASSPAVDVAGTSSQKSITGQDIVKSLSISERDVLLVMTGFCKMASREIAVTERGSYLHHGKLLALEILVKVLQNPQHEWNHVRPEFCQLLKQPLCITLLRSCATSDPAAFQLATNLLMATMTKPQLRRTIKAELGAFYPLLILQPLEIPTVQLQYDAALNVLKALKHVCADSHLVVDMFVNYDCDITAPNLYERTTAALARMANVEQKEVPPNASPQVKADAAAQAGTMRTAALRCLLYIVNSLDSWAAPLKDQLAGKAPETTRDASTASAANQATERQQEADRLGAAKSHKSSYSRGVALFNTHPVKGMVHLISSGVVEGNPVTVAQFIRTHAADLDMKAVGEYFGHHEDFEIAVMHAFIDTEKFEGLTIDIALRQLLAQFRLPGEAQKIERIMEKFAEVYCSNNPDTFRNADSAYILAFAIIMLNTDAHNPLAERVLTKPVFVSMNSSQDSGEPVLPTEDLEAIFDRVVSDEITLRDGSDKGTSSKLAAAVGLRNQKKLSKWDKKLVSDMERKRKILEQAKKAVARGAASPWYNSTHPEVTQPMLQVSGALILNALELSLGTAETLDVAELLVSALSMFAIMSGILGLDQLCEHSITILARACGLDNPAPYNSDVELRQLAALKALVGLASGSDAGILGGAWPIVLRTMTMLSDLVSGLTRPPAAGAPAVHAMGPSAHQGTTNPLNKMMQSLGFVNKPPSPQPTMIQLRKTPHGAYMPTTVPLAEAYLFTGGEEQLPPPVWEAPGSSIALWAIGDGARALEHLYSSSAMLDGDAVVVFFRALCAVSQEELDATRPRVHSLQKLVECAYHNIGRIRLIWTRLWAVVSSHLVSASCHSITAVAMYAVDALRQLMSKLLARAELAHFTHQEDALRPFSAVLRQCDDASVRELAVQSVGAAVSNHGRTLGSGWRTVLEALQVGVTDGSVAVAMHSLDILQVVIEAMVHGSSTNDFLHGCLVAIHRGVQNSSHPDLSIKAILLLQNASSRLSMPVSVEGLARAEGERGGENVGVKVRGATVKRLSNPGSAGTSSAPTTSREPWSHILSILAELFGRERRLHVTTVATEVAFDLVHSYSVAWPTAAWSVMMKELLPHIFCGPDTAKAQDCTLEELTAALLDRLHNFFPRMFDQLSVVPEAFRIDLLQALTDTCLGWFQQQKDSWALAGLSSLCQLMTALAVRESGAAEWAVVFDRLNDAVHEDLRLIMALVRMLQATQELTTHASHTLSLSSPTTRTHSMNSIAGISLSGEEVALLRCRCSMLGALQRTINVLHCECMSRTAWEVQLQLLNVVVHMTRTLARYNLHVDNVEDDGTEVEVEKIVEPPTHTLSQEHAHATRVVNGTIVGSSSTKAGVGKPPLPPSLPMGSHAILPSEEWEDSESEELATADASPPIPSSPHVTPATASIHAASTTDDPPHTPTHTSTDEPTPQFNAPSTPSTSSQAEPPLHLSSAPHASSHPLRTSSTASHHAHAPLNPPVLICTSLQSRDIVLPDLVRLETEGGFIALHGLQRCIERCKNSAKSGGKVASSSPLSMSHLHEVENQLSMFCRFMVTCAAVGTRAELASAAVLVGNTGSGAVSSTVSSGSSGNALCSWDRAVRGTLVCEAIRVYAGISTAPEHVMHIMPSLCLLVCSAHSSIRHAVADVLGAHVELIFSN